MDIPSLINQTIQQITPIAAAIPPIVGAEIIKESTKKLYSWVLEKFQNQGKENILESFIQQPDNLLLKEEVYNTLDNILIIPKNTEDLKTLLNQTKILQQNAEKIYNIEKIDTATFN